MQNHRLNLMFLLLRLLPQTAAADITTAVIAIVPVDAAQAATIAIATDHYQDCERERPLDANAWNATHA